MKYTKKQRNAIYRKALKKFHLIENNAYDLGLCYLISVVSGKTCNVYESSKENFPEFYAFSCTVPESDGTWYWPRDIGTVERYQIRKVILEFCIEMTN